MVCVVLATSWSMPPAGVVKLQHTATVVSFQHSSSLGCVWT